MAMTSNEVPTAAGMLRPPSRARAGTMRNPPPAPIRPAIDPIRAPVTIVRGSDGSRAPRPAGRPCSIPMAVASIITAKPVSRIPSGMYAARLPAA
ncbi:hypothetical protein L3i22_043810 [Actinoplanes sp. L3-i22]|nr:hypothetical protein L3i22_043810 [Actinoplanes sp. L3-i22]